MRSKLDTHKLVRDGITNVHWAMIKKSFDAGITHISIADRSIRTKAYVNSVQRLCTVILAGDNDSPELLTPWLDKADALVHEATYGCAMKQKIVARHQAGSGFDPMHASVQEVATVAKRCALPTLILTHFSARYDVIDDPTSQSTNMGHLRQEAEHCYDGKLILAKDFLCVEIDGAVATVTDAGPDVRIIDA